MEQFVEQSGLSLSSPEYAFLYKAYGGKWYRHIETDHPFFKQAWDIIQATEAAATVASSTAPVIEQIYDISNMRYHCLWTNVRNDIKTLNGPPNVISWTVEMAVPESLIQPDLFS
jgi:hypothetical protein